MRSTRVHRTILLMVFLLTSWGGSVALANSHAAKPASDDITAAAGVVTEGEVVVIEVKDYKFIPAEITVRVGTTVRWENHERRQYHNVYFEALADQSSDYFFPGEFREQRFDQPGTYPYICEPHIKDHDMKGVVHVVE